MAHTAAINAVVTIMGRLIDRKKPLSKTNISTAAATLTGSGATYLFLLESQDIKLQAMGFVLTLATLALAAYKEANSQ